MSNFSRLGIAASKSIVKNEALFNFRVDRDYFMNYKKVAATLIGLQLLLLKSQKNSLRKNANRLFKMRKIWNKNASILHRKLFRHC